MEKDIGKLNKNDQTDIVLRVDDFGGKRGLTIREYVTSDRYTGFTKAGVRISAQDFKKFKEMINSVSEEDMEAEPENNPEGSDSEGKNSLEGSGKENKSSADQEKLPDY